MHKFLKIIIV